MAALAGGYHAAWLVAAGTVLITIGITLVTLRPRRAEAASYGAADAAEEAA
jgi:hypothetical protein